MGCVPSERPLQDGIPALGRHWGFAQEPEPEIGCGGDTWCVQRGRFVSQSLTLGRTVSALLVTGRIQRLNRVPDAPRAEPRSHVGTCQARGCAHAACWRLNLHYINFYN